MDKQEKIVSPAVQKTGSMDSVGVVMCIGYGDEQSKSLPYGFCIGERSIRKLEVNGFMTNMGRFVDPVEAQQIAIACGQYRDPHARIKSLEESIEIGWDSVKYAKTGVMISSLKKRIAEDQATLDALKAGYLGNALRVEDLHYV